MIVAHEQLNLKFILDDDSFTATVVGQVYDDENVFIPRSMVFDSKIYKITKIGPKSFDSNKSIKNVFFSDYSEITIIEKECFARSSLEYIKIPKNVKKIANSAFEYCNQLKMVKFSEDSELISIGKYAFNDTGIKQITFPKHIKIIKKKLFNSSNIKIIKFAKDSELQKIESLSIFSDSLCKIYIPSNVVELEPQWCISKNLTQIVISPQNKYFLYLDQIFLISRKDPNNPNYDTLHRLNPQITRVTIPSFIKSIDGCALQSPNLKQVEFSSDSQLNSIEYCVFNSSKIEHLVIPPLARNITGNAIQQCEYLKTIEFLGDNFSNKFWFLSLPSLCIISLPNASKFDIDMQRDHLKEVSKDFSLFISPNAEVNTYANILKLRLWKHRFKPKIEINKISRACPSSKSTFLQDP